MKIRRRTPIAAVALVAAMAGALAGTVSTPPARAAATLLSQNKPATASSVEDAGTPASAAVDGDTTTRWSYLPPDQLALIQNFTSQGVPVVVLLTMPRPYVITDWTGLADAIVVTYRGGEEVGPAAASPLFGDFVHCGRLPWQLPRSLDQVLVPGGRDVPADAV